MKKILCIAFALLMCFSVCACGEKQEKAEEKGDVIDLEYFINLGQMPESEFKLGDDADEVVSSAEKEEDGQAPAPYQVGKRTAINVGEIRYYYDTEKKSEGINYMVSFAGGYGFSQGTLLSEITKELARGDLKAQPELLSEDEMFFFTVMGEFKGIKYSFGDNTACFIFDGEALCAVTLYKNYSTAE